MKRIMTNSYVPPLLLALFAAILTISIIARAMMMSSAEMIEDTSQHHMIALARAAALLTTADELDQFMTPDDMEKDAFMHLNEKLVAFTEDSGIAYTYYLRLDTATNMMQYIIDNSLEEETSLASPQLGREPAPDIALEGTAVAMDVGAYSDGWEGYLTAFAPVYYSDGRASNIIAGVDMRDVYIHQARDNISALSVVLIISLFAMTFFVLFVMMGLLKKNNRLGKNLESQTATLSTMFSAIPDIVFSMDANLFYTSCNPSFERLVGMSESEVVGKRNHEIFGIENGMGEQFSKINQTVLSTGRIILIEEVLTYPDGQKRSVKMVKTPLIQNGEVTGLLGIARDITERKESQLEIHAKNRLLDTVSLVARVLLSSETENFTTIIHKGLDILGRVADVDRVYVWKNWDGDDGRLHSTQLFEWSPEVEAQQGTDLMIDMIYDENAPTWEEPFKAGISVKGIVKDMPPNEREALDPQGVLSILAVPITIDNKLWGFIGFDDCHNERDFSDMEESILRACGHMIVSGIIKDEMTTNLIAAKEEAQAASDAKTQFLATMSHEIRTPLNAIIGLSEIQLRNDLPEGTCSDLEKIHASGSSLLGIINNILDISKIEAGGFELITMEYDSPSLINDTLQLNLVRIASKPITFKLEIDETFPAILYGDEMRVKQILNNLLSNAFKYTQRGSVTLRADWERLDGDDVQLIFTVSDTGIGIRNEDIDRLFSEYSQLDLKANRMIEGTGLGLFITQKLLKMMDGTITVESEYGVGTSFTIKFKQQAIGSGSIGTATAQNLSTFQFMADRRAIAKNLVYSYMPYGKVLIVDDVPTNLDVARGLMMPYGLTIDCASSGREAIELIRHEKTRYDVVFMDHMMPEMDGVEAVRIIREDIGTEYAKTVPIIALTANALSGYEEMFSANGFNAFISKPIDIMRLDTVLGQWVRNKQSDETLKTAVPDRWDPGTEAASVIAEGTRIDGIRLNEGARRYGREDVYLDILRSYVTHTPELLRSMETVSRESLPQYAITVHGLKGSSYGILADAIGKQAEALEEAAKAGDFEAVSAGNGALLTAANALLDALDALLQSARQGDAQKPMKPSPDGSLLTQMLEAAKMYKTSLMDELMAELTQYSYESGAGLVEWIRERLDNLDYEAIQERLEDAPERNA